MDSIMCVWSKTRAFAELPISLCVSKFHRSRMLTREAKRKSGRTGFKVTGNSAASKSKIYALFPGAQRNESQSISITRTIFRRESRSGCVAQTRRRVGEQTSFSGALAVVGREFNKWNSDSGTGGSAKLRNRLEVSKIQRGDLRRECSSYFSLAS